MLQYLCASRCGMHENELLELMPGMSNVHLCYMFHFLTTHLILKYQGGLFTFAHQQVSIQHSQLVLFPDRSLTLSLSPKRLFTIAHQQVSVHHSQLVLFPDRSLTLSPCLKRLFTFAHQQVSVHHSQLVLFPDH